MGKYLAREKLNIHEWNPFSSHPLHILFLSHQFYHSPYVNFNLIFLIFFFPSILSDLLLENIKHTKVYVLLIC